MRCCAGAVHGLPEGEDPPCPMWVMKVSDFLNDERQLFSCHEELQERCQLIQWQPDFFTIFVSHQWLGQHQPDPTGHQSQCLRRALQNIISGSVQVSHDVLAQSLAFSRRLSRGEAEDIAHGYLWLDWMSVPQRDSQAAAEKLCKSVHIYVERADLFCILAPAYQDPDCGTHFSYASWERRGWCRAEMWFKQLSMRAGQLPILLITSPVTVQFLRAHFWLYAYVHEGGFKERADADALKHVVEAFLMEQLDHLLQCKKLNHYRYFKARYERIAGAALRTRTLEEFLADFRFREGTLGQTSGIGPVACAVLSGDVPMLHQLLAKRACMNCKTPNLPELDVMPAQTPLQLAAKHTRDPKTIVALLESKAEINQVDGLGTSVLGHAGSAEVVQVLIDSRADLNQRKGPFGMPALTACILLPLEPRGVSLMIEARAEVNTGSGMYSLSPLTTATVTRHMPHNTEIFELLLAARADVNLREGMYKPLELFARGLCKVMKTPPALIRGIATNSGSTPVLAAAWFGNPEMVRLLLDARADPTRRNHRGQTYQDVLHDAFCASSSTGSPCEYVQALEMSSPSQPSKEAFGSQRSPESHALLAEPFSDETAPKTGVTLRVEPPPIEEASPVRGASEPLQIANF